MQIFLELSKLICDIWERVTSFIPLASTVIYSQWVLIDQDKIYICGILREISSSYTLNPLRFSPIRNWYFDEKSDQSLIIDN